VKIIAARCGGINMDIGLIHTGRMLGATRHIPVMTFFIETTDGVVVWDTGMCPSVSHDAIGYLGRVAKRAVVPQYHEGEDVVSRLAQAGYGVGDVSLVVNSHLHWDHAGMNTAFPAARLVIRKRELEFAQQESQGNGGAYISSELAQGPEVVLFDYDDTHDLTADGSLRLVSTPGHTPGHQCLLVRGASGARFLLSGDAVYDGQQLEEGRPPGVLWHEPTARHSVERMRQIERGGAKVLICHDPDHWTNESLQLVYDDREGEANGNAHIG
jgi:N-acyl homoserine lactone hydrolase